VSIFSPLQLAALQQAIEEAYESESLAHLARYRLGKRLDLLVNVNQAFPAVAFALIQLVELRGWTDEFVRGVYEERKENPFVARFVQVHAQFVFDPRTGTGDLAKNIGDGLGAVAERLADPHDPVRAVLVEQTKQTLAYLGSQFTRLSRYKRLHDCLHNLQFKYARLIATELRDFQNDPMAADNLAIYLQEMADELAQCRPQCDGLESQAAEQMWLNVADESVRRMQAGVAKLKQEDISKGYALLEGVLRVQPTRINEMLGEIMERLQLDRLREGLLQLDASTSDGIGRAAEALGMLSPRLNGILSDHKEWQLVDNTLRQIGTELKEESGLETSGFLWSEATKVLDTLLDRDREAGWAVELRQLESTLNRSFVDQEIAAVQTAFNRLFPRTMWYFYQADKDLKVLSGELDKIGDKLRDILREVRNANN
jgi:hypothetical protein